MWVMVLGDLIIFGAYFIVYTVHRAMAPEAFLTPNSTSTSPSGSSTRCAVGSRFVARGVQAARAGGMMRRFG